MKREAMSHTKMKRLCRRLDIPTWQGVGLLESLWHITGRECPQGDIGKLSDEDIALAIDYRGDESKMLEALISSGWIDRNSTFRLVIHDWFDHADDAVHMRLARTKQHFCDGRVPKLSRLSQSVRNECAQFYDSCAQNGIVSAKPVTSNQIPVPVTSNQQPEPCAAADEPPAQKAGVIAMQPRWKSDPDFRVLVDAAADFWGDLIDSDFEQAYFVYPKMDFEEKLKVIDAIKARKVAGIEPRFVPKLINFLRNKEFNRPIKARDPPVDRNKTGHNEAMAAAKRIRSQQESLR